MIDLDIFTLKVKNNELQVIPKGTKFKMLDRIDINPNIENSKAGKFNGWIGREGVLDDDIYVGEYPELKEGEERKYFLSDIHLNARLKFSENEGIYTSNIKKATYNTGISIIETQNTIYVLDIFLVNITLDGGENYLWDYSENPHILVEGMAGSGKTVTLKSIENDIRKQGYKVILLNHRSRKYQKELSDLFIRTKDDEQLFLLLDDVYGYNEKVIELFKIGRSLNISVILAYHKQPLEEILSNCSIKLIPTNDNYEWTLSDGVEEKIVRFPLLRSE